MEVKVRLEGADPDQPWSGSGLLSDLSLGGARLRTPVELQLDWKLRLRPFTSEAGSPLSQPLDFTVVWQSASEGGEGSEHEWDYYGLRHDGPVLAILESWLGHLLLRRHQGDELVVQRRQHRRLRFPESAASALEARVSHDGSACRLTLLDIGPGGLLARGEEQLPVGVHLEFSQGLEQLTADDWHEPVSGWVIDSHRSTQGTFYRVSFDSDSELDEERLVDWATGIGARLE